MKNAGWHFDYKAAERKRFKGELMWDPTYLKEHDVDEYLLNAFKKWPLSTGMKEEIALKILLLSNYNVNQALLVMDSPKVIVELFTKMNQYDEKIE
jgi:hypothetical protein